MPAAAVASFTPANAGISGTSVGASGEAADDMEKFRKPRETTGRKRDGRDKAPRAYPGHDDCRYYWLRRSDSRFLLLRRRHLGIGRLHRIRLRGIGLSRFGGLIHALDLGGFAQLRDVVGLRLARHIRLDLGLDLLEVGRLAVALFLD